MNEKTDSLLDVLEDYLRHRLFRRNDLPTRYLNRIAEIIRDENRRELRYEDFRTLHPRIEEEWISSERTLPEKRRLLADNVYIAISALRKRLDAVSKEGGLRPIALVATRKPDPPYIVQVADSTGEASTIAPASNTSEAAADAQIRADPVVQVSGELWITVIMAAGTVLGLLAVIIGPLLVLSLSIHQAWTYLGSNGFVSMIVFVLALALAFAYIWRALQRVEKDKFTVLLPGLFLRREDAVLILERISQPCPVCGSVGKRGIMTPAWDRRHRQWILACSNNASGHRMAFDYVTRRATPLR